MLLENNNASISVNVRESIFPKSGKFLLVKSRILCFGFRNPPKGNQNHANDCNPEYKFH